MPSSWTSSHSLLPRSDSLTAAQGLALDSVERVVSLLSLVGCLLLILSFLTIKNLRARSFNRLLFLAACGNIFSNIATFIGHSGIRGGNGSAICKFQATLIQWFMPADGLWAFCMAVNVFLTFHTTKIDLDIRRFEKWYFFLCFGVSGIPALTYLLLDVFGGTDFYGDAVLWCWISKNHDTLRLYTFYAPVWVTIVVTMILYALAGRAIYRGQIRNQRMKYALSDFVPRRCASPTSPEKLGSVTKCTEISQISEVLHQPTPRPSAESIALPDARSSFSSESQPAKAHYPPSFDTQTTSVGGGVDLGAHTKITTTVEATYVAPTLPPIQRRTETQTNKGARTYACVAFSLYIVMLVTWVPSTANRVYGVVHADALNFGLNLLAATVLPLQGFFNTCVYMFISRHELYLKFNELRGRVVGRREGRTGSVAELKSESRASSTVHPRSPVGSKDIEAAFIRGNLPLQHWQLRNLTTSDLFKNAVSEFV